MLTLEKRIELLDKLGKYMLSDDEHWKEIQERAIAANSWFTKEFVSIAVKNIASQYLDKEKLETWVKQYPTPAKPLNIGIVMAGNIPLVGFHDFLCGFITGHQLSLKLSSKDQVLLLHLISKLTEWQPEIAAQINIADNLKGCDAYIATGSNNTARYFEQYFGKYPHIIRRNRTSVAVLDGTETEEELKLLGKDIFTYFGLGCRNITQICIPEGYDLKKFLDVMSSYSDMMLHHKYKNNFDYHLAIYLLNKVPYLSNDSLLMVENILPFSAVSVLHYRHYTDKSSIIQDLQNSADIQSISGHSLKPFGTSQSPALDDYADNIDTMNFLTGTNI